MRVLIRTVPHGRQRYPTAGDWYPVRPAAGGLLPPHDQVVVSDTGDDDSNLLVAVHELVEMHLCKRDGVGAEAVDAWDTGFKGEGEPGDDPRCPYRHQHGIADKAERFLAGLLGVDWAEHERRVDNLGGER